ncbi:hypothetical protein PO81_04520, partial [Vibrio parahaemolyticus]
LVEKNNFCIYKLLELKEICGIKLFDLKTKQDKLKNMSYQVYARRLDLIQTELKWCAEMYKIL